MSTDITFGPVLVADKKLSASGNTVAVKLQQSCATTYPPGSREHLLLQEKLDHHAEGSHVVRSLRKATQRLSLDKAAELNIGDEVGGHIQRILRSTPRYATQKPAYEGGYAFANWLPAYAEDIDLRVPEPV